ncbi:TRAP transporter small permease [Desulfosporosinus fructosivorans]|uniref:TRAP transporter small permease n=1 Tax=Desulfosporosinus fructosivorans TaxID=2018669 RepID=A0A4Z0R1T3_9FIRM|nr:TRAP transporter small permease [Desulfosporosinus fructosivorans]TGE36133.1 TRAP transporter small permease [Desulfosporosinus fructosivorans]
MKKFWKAFAFVEDVTSGGLLFLGVTVIFYGVIMRYVFNDARSWVDEVSQYMIIWGTLIGTSVALRNNHHIKVDMLFEKFPNKVKYLVTLFAHAVGVSFGIFLIYYGGGLVKFTYISGQLSTDVGIPLFKVYSILPLMGFLLTLRFLVKLYETIKDNGQQWEAHKAERKVDLG